MLVILVVLVFGNIIAWWACVQASFGMLLVGCFFFSIGSQCYLVVSNSIEAYWFKDKETAVALSIDSSASYLAVAGVYWTLPMLYEYTGSLSWCFAVSIFLSILSLIDGLILARLDKIAVPSQPEPIEQERKPSVEGVNKQPLKSLGYGYVLLVLAYTTRVLGYNLFEFISSEYYQVRFKFSLVDTGFIISIPYLLFFVMTAPCGILVYRYGRKPLIMAVALAVMALAMCWLAALPNGRQNAISIVPFAIFAFGNVFVSAAFWPSVP